MLTFEKVLEAFKEHLERDPLYEVVLTSHGYTLMAWEPSRTQWYSAEYCATPEDLRDALLMAYESYQEAKITQGERDLTAAEQKKIDMQKLTLVALCESK